MSKIILGIDPGTTVMGYALISTENNEPKLMQFGVIMLEKYDDHFIRLQKIFERCSALIEEYKPDEIALESPFYGKNIQVMLKIGRAQGVAMAAAMSKSIPVFEYAPRKIKQSVTGNGNASKEQVAKMLQNLLADDLKSDFFDATDALAVCLCHFYSNKIPQNKSKSWSAFVKDNQDRIA
jgi:crossover junction endodeoxyribonuclease RuvC